MFDKGLGNISYVPLWQINRNNLNEVARLFEDAQALTIGSVCEESLNRDYRIGEDVKVGSIRDMLTRRADSRKLRIENGGGLLWLFSLKPI